MKRTLKLGLSICATVVMFHVGASAKNEGSNEGNKSAVICKCVKYNKDLESSYYMLQASYVDRLTGKVRDLMMGAYASQKDCLVNAKRLADLGRCRIL